MRAAAVVMLAVLAGCTSESLVPCSAQATCDPLGAFCVDGFCRRREDVDLAGVDEAVPECLSDDQCKLPARPICDPLAHVCRACVEGDCGGATPGCATAGPLAGQCVECAAARDCTAARQTCNLMLNQCAGCERDDQCELGYCAEGSCARAIDIAYVDRDASCLDEDGSPAKPFCGFGSAIAAKKPFLIVGDAASAYDNISLTNTGPGFVRIIGPGSQGKAEVELADVPALKISATGSAVVRLIVSGMSLIGGGSSQPAKPAGVECSVDTTGNAFLTITDSAVSARDGDGLKLSGCRTTLRRDRIAGAKMLGIRALGGQIEVSQSRIADNGGGGLLVDGGATYDVINDLFTRNGVSSPGYAVELGQATGTFAFNGLYDNATSGGGGIGCSGSQVLSASIMLRNSFGTLAGMCVIDGVITTSGTDGTTAGDPQVDADYRLIPGDAKNLACCIDKRTSGPAIDVDGAARPKGAGWDIGPHEVE